jgi:hypothetical protein
MTLRNFPPADQCAPEDLDAIADLVVSDPSASWDLAGSREHIEALCRRYQALAQDLSVSARTIEEHAAEHAAMASDSRALQEQIAAMANDLDQARNGWQADILLRDAAEGRREDAETCAMMWQAITDRALQDAKRVPAEQLVVDANLDTARELVRERRAHERTRGELAKALGRLEEIQQSERLRGAFADACLGVTGQSIEQVNIQLDAEIAAHPDAGPLHHARDQRDHQEDTTP